MVRFRKAREAPSRANMLTCWVMFLPSVALWGTSYPTLGVCRTTVSFCLHCMFLENLSRQLKAARNGLVLTLCPSALSPSLFFLRGNLFFTTVISLPLTAARYLSIVSSRANKSLPGDSLFYQVGLTESPRMLCTPGWIFLQHFTSRFYFSES